MNRFQIDHQTTYAYSGPVWLGPHALRLRPREGHDLRIESSELLIRPSPLLRWHRDVEGNSVAMARFSGPADRLQVESRLTIQQYDQEPLDFVVDDAAALYPFAYAPEDRPVLDAYRRPAAAPLGVELLRWLETLWRPGETIESYVLLERLNRGLTSRIAYRQRDEPGVQAPTETFVKASGSCRDLAVLFMEVSRWLGFAARFVSGYSCTSQDVDGAGSTHAWAEVFLPGAGWKGFDPTRGEIVGVNHIPVAVGRLPHSVPPIAGTFFGGSRLLSMDVSVRVQRI